MKGKGLKLVHHFGDQLWAIGDKSAPAGFTPTCILPQVQNKILSSANSASTAGGIRKAKLKIEVPHVHAGHASSCLAVKVIFDTETLCA